MYKLTYFDIPGRGEPARLIFAAAGVNFVDDRVDFAKWGEIKPTIEGGKLPILHVDGKILTQSKTIYRYLAQKFKLTGADEWEAAKCDELVDATGDLADEYIDFFFLEKDAEKKAEKKSKYETVSLPAFLKRLDKIQEENGGQWLVGKQLTWADITVVEFIRQLTEATPEVVSEYPHVKKLIDAVFAQEDIKEFKNSKK